MPYSSRPPVFDCSPALYLMGKNRYGKPHGSSYCRSKIQPDLGDESRTICMNEVASASPSRSVAHCGGSRRLPRHARSRWRRSIWPTSVSSAKREALAAEAKCRALEAELAHCAQRQAPKTARTRKTTANERKKFLNFCSRRVAGGRSRRRAVRCGRGLRGLRHLQCTPQRTGLSHDEMADAIAYCRARNVKTNITLNILVQAIAS